MTRLRAGMVAAGLALLFAASRAPLVSDPFPYFEADTWKYLGGADSLRSEGRLSVLFRDVPVHGGTLHVMPGYAGLLAGVWALAGRVTFTGATLVQTLASLLGFGLAAALVRSWVGSGAALVAFAVLTLSPSIAWLEATLVPDALAAPLLIAACWCGARRPAPNHPWRGSAWSGFSAGVGMGASVLLRTASQVFVPIPACVAMCTLRGRGERAVWLASYAAALLLCAAPWMLHNGRHHGIYRLTASTGRNLYLSALWSDTIDRSARARELGFRVPARDPRSAWRISDRTLEELMGRGLSLPEADVEMRRMALAAYRERGPATVVRQRAALVGSLFLGPAPADMPIGLRPLLPRLARNPDRSLTALRWAEDRFGHRFGAELRRAVPRPPPTGSPTWRIARVWMRVVVVDGPALLAAYAVSVPVLALLGAFRWPAFWSFAAPPLAFLAVFFLVGSPLYRYQVVLHPFMLVTIVLALATVWTRLRGRPGSAGAAGGRRVERAAAGGDSPPAGRASARQSGSANATSASPSRVPALPCPPAAITTYCRPPSRAR